jgi:predicted  nucleic acid-binding Zn-ribbon protein
VSDVDQELERLEERLRHARQAVVDAENALRKLRRRVLHAEDDVDIYVRDHPKPEDSWPG